MIPSGSDLLDRIHKALSETRTVYEAFDHHGVEELKKAGGDPITMADLELDRVLKENLLAPGEGWLSEETADSTDRLSTDLVWIVDPLDGTREFIDGLPEFCSSVAAVVNGRPLAGGILNPAADLLITGAVGQGVQCNGRPVSPLGPTPFESMRVLASRSEWTRGQWEVVEEKGLDVVPMGSVAYKMARVAAGLDHATWTPVPKHEWDVAGGAALLAAGGGHTLTIDLAEVEFNQQHPWLSGAIASPPGFEAHLDMVVSLIEDQVEKD